MKKNYRLIFSLFSLWNFCCPSFCMQEDVSPMFFRACGVILTKNDFHQGVLSKKITELCDPFYIDKHNNVFNIRFVTKLGPPHEGELVLPNVLGMIKRDRNLQARYYPTSQRIKNMDVAINELENPNKRESFLSNVVSIYGSKKDNDIYDFFTLASTETKHESFFKLFKDLGIERDNITEQDNVNHTKQ